jgi:hypothetical protein
VILFDESKRRYRRKSARDKKCSSINLPRHDGIARTMSPYWTFRRKSVETINNFGNGGTKLLGGRSNLP